MRLGIMASGRGSNARSILENVRGGRLQAEVPVVLCNRTGASVLNIAREFSVETHLVVRSDFPSREAQQQHMLNILQDAEVDTVALAGFSAIFKGFFLEAFPERIFNIHPSLLPAFAGTQAPQPQADALAAGVKVAGCTVHLITGDLDAGPIVAQRAVCVQTDDTVETLAARILKEEHRLYPEVLQWFAEGRVHVKDGIAHLDPRPAVV